MKVSRYECSKCNGFFENFSSKNVTKCPYCGSAIKLVQVYDIEEKDEI